MNKYESKQTKMGFIIEGYRKDKSNRQYTNASTSHEHAESLCREESSPCAMKKQAQKAIQKAICDYIVNLSPVEIGHHAVENKCVTVLFMNNQLFFLDSVTIRNREDNNKSTPVVIDALWTGQSVRYSPSAAYSIASAETHSVKVYLTSLLKEYGVTAQAIVPTVVITTPDKNIADADKNQIDPSPFSCFHASKAPPQTEAAA